MNPSTENPIYVVLLLQEGMLYDISNAVESLELSEAKGQLAVSATVHLMNMQIKGVWLNTLIQARDRIFIYADDGTTNGEVFRGFVWTRRYKSSLSERALQLQCYDNLIYFQQSEESEFFPAGKSTQDVVAALCDKWGIPLSYDYQSITHSKLVLRGYLSDILLDDILDVVKDQTGVKYVVLSTQDVLQIKTAGTNPTIYCIEAGKNAVSAVSTVTMDELVTQVKILGKADDEDRLPVEAVAAGNTGKYGTLQKLVDRDENTTLEEAKTEAQNILNENGTPKKEYEVTATDVPWIRKGDRVWVQAGGIFQTQLVVGVSRSLSATQKTMTLELEDL